MYQISTFLSTYYNNIYACIQSMGHGVSACFLSVRYMSGFYGFWFSGLFMIRFSLFRVRHRGSVFAGSLYHNPSSAFPVWSVGRAQFVLK